MSAGPSSDNFMVSDMGVGKEVVTSVTLTPNANGLSGILGAGSTYTVTPSLAKGSGGFLESNYNITYVPFADVVTPRTLVVTADNKSKGYGAVNPLLTISYAGLVNGDILATLPTVSTPAVVSSPAGSYPITVSGATDPNYSISYGSGVLTVNKAFLTVTANTQTKVYGSPDPQLTYNYTPALFGKDIFTGELSRTAGEKVGAYPIILGTLSAGPNYNITLLSKDLGITPKLLTIGNPVLTTSKTYDGTTHAVVGAGVLTGLVAGDESNITVSAVANYSDKNVGSGKTINVTYALSGPALDNYIQPALSVISNGEITAKQLAISNTSVVTNKMVDGNTTAAVQSAGALVGVEAVDVNSVTVSAVATYNDASAGISKIITVLYSLGGSAAYNYLVPANQIITGAKISEKVVIINAVLSTTAGCEGANLDLTYTVLSGNPVQYQIVFGAASLAQGFRNIDYTNLPSSGNSGTVTIPVPSGTPYGNYQASIQFRNELGVVSDAYSFQFVVNVPADYIVAKFDDVVLCNNESNSFTSFQWYKNGKAIDGATKQYYSDPNGLVGAYSVQLHRTNGSEFNTCPKVLNIPLKKKVTVSVYPNPVKVNQTSMVKISGLSDEELYGAVMDIYNIQGMKVYSTVKVEQLNSLNIQNQDGVYMGHVLTANGSDYLFRILLVQ